MKYKIFLFTHNTKKRSINIKTHILKIKAHMARTPKGVQGTQ